MSAPLPLAFEGHAVRCFEIDGAAWFVAKDVCDVFGLTNSRKAVGDLDDDEKGVTNSDTPGGRQRVSIISESGLYALTFKSRKPEARRFRKWVTAEVLPAIRRNGAYGGQSAGMARLTDAVTALAEGQQELVQAVTGLAREQGADRARITALEAEVAALRAEAPPRLLRGGEMVCGGPLDLDAVQRRLKALRLSAAEASRRASPVGSPDVIRDLRRGKTAAVRAETLIALAAVLHCHPDELRAAGSEASPGRISNATKPNAPMPRRPAPAKRRAPRLEDPEALWIETMRRDLARISAIRAEGRVDFTPISHAARRLTTAGDPIERSALSRYCDRHGLKKGKQSRAIIVDYLELREHRLKRALKHRGTSR